MEREGGVDVPAEERVVADLATAVEATGANAASRFGRGGHILIC